MQSLTIRRPDDFHVHLRTGAMLRLAAFESAAHFQRVLVMPNTTPSIRTPEEVGAYRAEILAAAPGLEPLMTIKLADHTTPTDVALAARAGVVAAKFYPRGATTNAEDGVTDLLALDDTLRAMEEVDMVLCLHGECPSEFSLDREMAFLSTLKWLARRFRKLRIVLEHVTSKAGIAAVESLGPNVAATITAHHLVLTLDDVVGDRIEPHHFCKPIPKRPEDRAALLAAATSGGPKFFFGSDSAPHTIATKEARSGCAGVYSAPVALQVLAESFEKAGYLSRLETFTSVTGAQFYKLPFNTGEVTLVRKSWAVPHTSYLPEDHDLVVRPFRAGQILPWQVVT